MDIFLDFKYTCINTEFKNVVSKFEKRILTKQFFSVTIYFRASAKSPFFSFVTLFVTLCFVARQMQ